MNLNDNKEIKDKYFSIYYLRYKQIQPQSKTNRLYITIVYAVEQRKQ